MRRFPLLRGFPRFVNDTLKPSGWIQSRRQSLPVDRASQPLPWWTYPAIEFVATIVHSGFRVFEYGGGHSTLWWVSRGARVTAVDHNTEWVRSIASRIDSPSQILLVNAGETHTEEARGIADTYFQSGPRTVFRYDNDRTTQRGLNDGDFVAYASAIHATDEQFDCIVIDGMARRMCAYFAVPQLKDDGIIIFDNSNRSDYLEGYQYLISSGFRQIRLWGNVPGSTFPSCTSIFVRDLASLPTIDFQPSVFGIPEY